MQMRLRSFSNALTLATAAGSLVATAPSAHGGHKHHHDHQEYIEKREYDSATINSAGTTMVIYELNGEPMSETDVCQGI